MLPEQETTPTPDEDGDGGALPDDSGGGFHQPAVSTMLGSSPGSPFRAGTGHRAPWPPPSHHAAEGFGRYGVSGGLYSLFPGSTDGSATIYSQATSATRFSHSNTYHSFIGSHKVADSLFSTGYTFGGPTPPPSAASGPPFTPLVERGITQLELMAKGFNNNNNNNNNNNSSVEPPAAKKSESKRRADCSLYQDGGADRRGGASKRRWERDSQPSSTPPVVKSEVTTRPSCGCRRSNLAAGSPSSLSVRSGPSSSTNDVGVMSTPFPAPQCERKPPPSLDAHQNHHHHHHHHHHQQQQQQQQPQQHHHQQHGSNSHHAHHHAHHMHAVQDERKKLEGSGGGGGGCSRTTPVSLRAAPDWFGSGVVIKKEPAGGGTPCQVAEVTTSLRHGHSTAASLSPLATVIKVEGGRKDAATSAASMHTQHLAVNTVGSIPVGIAVARQRLQDVTSKPPPPQALVLTPVPEHLPPRPQKTLAPAPAPVPEVTAADLAAAPLSTMILQPQCEDRVANGIAPWAATATHNPALTPPTLWQYPASVPVQLGPAEHLPLPPVGYQLVRDPISGHFLLIPTTNIEHLQRTVLWPSYPATIQPSLPATQHIQLFESAEPTEYSAQTARILVQPQLTITAAPAPVDAAKRKPAVIKIEDCGSAIVDGSSAIVKSRSTEVSVATNTVSVPVLSSGTTTVTPVSQFFYDHSTAVVQLAQTPQPSASVQTDNGKRSQATSPVNPAETCLTPPPETATTHSENEDASTTSLVVPTSTDTPVQVQDASNQTDTPPISEDETCVAGVGKLLTLDPPAGLVQQLPVPPPQTTTVPPPRLPSPAVDSHPSLAQPACSPATLHPSREADDRRHEAGSPGKQTEEMVDLSGLELLSNSIEQFENIHLKVVRSGPLQQPADAKPAAKPAAAGNAGISPRPAEDSKQDGDSRPSVEKAAETLQLLCQQSAQLKKLDVEPAVVAGSDSCDKPTVEVSDKVIERKKHERESGELQGTGAGESGNGMLGGLGLLCALAEQRFMEEVASGEPKSSVVSPARSSAVVDDPALSGGDSSAMSSVDVNRNYRTRESERECKKFIANKVLQYYQNGNRSGSSSPQHSQHHSLLSGICTSPTSAEFMDAMELDMRMRLAELQRKYREKQRELSKLTPKKPGSESGSSSVTSPEAPGTGGNGPHPAKRGPGRPRKKCNKLVLDSPPLSPPSSGSCAKFRSGKLSNGKAKDSNRDPPPPVLEKVTDIQQPRSRFDSEDCVAPKLKASRLDILKPPMLTANKILTCAKFKPATASSSTDKGIKLPRCNVNLVKLNSGQQDTCHDKETAGKISKNNSIITDSNKGKLSPLSFTDGSSALDKLSAFTSGRLPLMHAPSHTFGSKPSTCLLGAGETESLFWFKNSEMSSCFGKLSDRSSPEVENSDQMICKLKSSPTPPPLSPPMATFASVSPLHMSTSSSKKRKVGRPKKHLTMTGCELTTETIVAKKPKSKSSLVGLLLSKNRHSSSPASMQNTPTNSVASNLFKPIANSGSPEHALSFSKLSSTASKSTAAEGSSAFGKPFTSASVKNVAGNGASLDGSVSSGCKYGVAPTPFKCGGSLGRSKNSLAVGQKKNGSVVTTDLSAADGHKPKIRPKLKAEAKVKTWSWCEDEDAVAIDWPVPTPEKNQDAPLPVQAQAWTKKTEKTEKTEKATAKAAAAEGPGRPQKRKLSADGKCAAAKSARKGQQTGKGKEKHSNNNNNNSNNSGCEKKAVAEGEAEVEGATSTATSTAATSTAATSTAATSTAATSTAAAAAGPAKKQRRNNSSCHSSGGGTSESEDLPLSMLSRHSQASCVLTQAHLNVDKQRALTVMGGLFYAGTIGAIRAPDVYGITLDGERGNRPHIFSQEEILRDAILEVRVSNISTLTPGMRVCAYWSQQYRCLYPGTVAEPSSPDSDLDAQFVSVEFDDGDNGRINVDDIRLLPVNYPIVEYDPNPLLTLGKRRRRNSGTSCESHSKDRRTSGEASAPTTNGSSTKTAEDQSVEKSDGDGVGGKDGRGVSPGESGACEALLANSRCEDKLPDDALEDGKRLRLGVEEQTKDDSSDLSSRERKRLKKRRREKLKRLLSCSGVALSLDGSAKKRHKKHRCSDEHSRHRRHHRRHRRHKHRRGSRNKDSSAGSSAESSSKTSGDVDSSSRLSPVLEQLDILEIQQTAIRQLQASNQMQAAEAPREEASAKKPKPDGAEEKAVPESDSTVATSEPSVPNVPATENKKGKKDKEAGKVKKGRDRQPSVESRSKMAAFLPARQLWGWSGRGFKRPGAKGRGKKEFFKAIQRGKETIRVGDCAVFLSTGRPDRPYIGRIESMWESWGTNMVVRVKWFYHPEETNGCPVQLKYPGALFESPHVDENDVQTISHKCEVLPLSGYTERLGSEPQRYSTIYDNNDIYYLAGYYDPTTSQLTMEPGIV